MAIRIRQNNDNKISSQNKIIDVEYTGVDVIESLNLKFVTVSSPTDAGELYHSNDTLGDSYLNYGSTGNASMQISLPIEGVYVLKILAEKITMVDGDITTVSLNAAGELIETITTGPIPSSEYFESGEVELVYTSNYEWT